ncbi:MAG: glycosyltransferase [Bacillota bacterium]
MTGIWAVIPACNEEPRVAAAVNSARQGGAARILVVDNGSMDRTGEAARDAGAMVLHFDAALGPDLPRAAGAHLAVEHGADLVVFIDGDMTGRLGWALAQLLDGCRRGAALALTDAFLGGIPGQGLAGEVTAFRRKFNETVGLYDQLGVAIMSHGPSAAGRAFLLSVGCRALGKPPVAMALATRAGLPITVGCRLSHDDFGSPGRDAGHGLAMAETIIGDCLEGMAVFRGEKPQRSWQGRVYLGFDPCRRWDLLDRWLESGPGR